MLVDGVRDRRADFHTPTIATIDLNGAPSLRTIVLRACDADARQLRFHTDTRSNKIKEIETNPSGAMHLYDRDKKIQIRLQTRLSFADAATTTAAWDRTQAMSRECYQVTLPPGQQIATPQEAQFDPLTTQDGWDHFQPVIATIEKLEWLYLAAKGHRRALFDYSNGTVTRSWLIP
jgi:3-hydroxyisobutyrate dehydrogenase